jgi:hypothetical protein
MATNGGGKIIRDGLVFGYDSGYGVANNNTATRFYRGEPTENKILNVGVNAVGWSEHGWSGSFVTTSDHENTFELTSTNGWHNATFNHGVSTGTVNVSFEYKLKSKQTTGIWGFVLNGTHLGSYTNWIGSLNSTNLPSLTEWKTFSGTYTGNGDTKLAIGLRGNDSQGLTDTMYVRNLQVENKDHQTPFTIGTRSSTNSLIDLTKPTDDYSISSLIYVGDISFDSTGQPTFDGTNDGINLGDQSNFDFTNGICSIEAIVKFPSSWTGGSQYPNLISKGASAGWDTNGWSLFGFRDWGGKKSWGFGMRNGSTNRIVSRNNVAEDVFWHIVATLDGTTMRLYENGVEVSTNTQTINPAENTTNVYIGRGPNSQYFPGDLPVSKIYSRTLSPEQIEQNYKVYKNRFDL